METKLKYEMIFYRKSKFPYEEMFQYYDWYVDNVHLIIVYNGARKKPILVK